MTFVLLGRMEREKAAFIFSECNKNGRGGYARVTAIW